MLFFWKRWDKLYFIFLIILSYLLVIIFVSFIKLKLLCRPFFESLFELFQECPLIENSSAINKLLYLSSISNACYFVCPFAHFNINLFTVLAKKIWIIFYIYIYFSGISRNQAFPEMPRQLRKFVIFKIYLRILQFWELACY